MPVPHSEPGFALLGSETLGEVGDDRRQLGYLPFERMIFAALGQPPRQLVVHIPKLVRGVSDLPDVEKREATPRMID
jgi:hypothetical protein